MLCQPLLDSFRFMNTVDIIANKLLSLPAVNSKVVQSTGDLHHEIVVLFFRISEQVFDNSTSFHPTNDMRNDNPDAGDETVVLFLCWGQLFSFGFLPRLKCLHPLGFIPLKASIFIHTDVHGVRGAFFISNPCIMTFAFIGLAQIIAFARMDSAKNAMLDRVCFFLPL